MKVSISAFKKDPERYLKEAQEGKSIEITKRGKSHIVLAPKSATNLSHATFSATSSLKAGSLAFGLFSNSLTGKADIWDSLTFTNYFDAHVRPVDIVHWFIPFSNPDGYKLSLFDSNIQTVLGLTGQSYKRYIPLITWEANQSYEKPIHIARGDHDAFLLQWAKDIATLKAPIYLRPFPEMNGDWTNWHEDPLAYKQAWQRMHSLFAQMGANQYVYWLWCPNVSDQMNKPFTMEDYFPGHAYVNGIGLDGYNRGNTTQHHWTEMEQIFLESYQRLSRHPEIRLDQRDFWIAETGTVEQNGLKAAWLRNMLNSRLYPNLVAVVYFDAFPQGDYDYRINQHQYLAAMHQANDIRIA